MRVPEEADGKGDRGGSASRVLSWLDEDEPPPPEEPPLRFGRPVLPEPPNDDHPDPAPDPVPPPVKAESVPVDAGAVLVDAGSVPVDAGAAPGGDGAVPGETGQWFGAVAPGQSGAPRRGFALSARAASAVVVLALVAGGLYLAGRRFAGDDPGAPDSAARVVSAPLDGLDRADFELATGATTVNVRGGAPADALYRISTPEGGASVPRVERRGDRIVLRLVRTGRDGPDEVDIQLSGRVSWTVRLTGGAATRVVDASRLALRGLTVATGSTRIDLSLPKPTSRVPIRLAGGFDTLAVRLPVGVPARLAVGEGAGRVVIDGRIREGVAAGRILGTVGWQKSPRRFEIDLTAGAATVTVRRRDR